jgi:tetratricopeptide (TPR) repeat protein
MERAVARELGRITPEIAAGILRDRSDARFVNDFVVGNALVLNAAIVHPASGTLWHSTSMQPHAPFGAYTPLRLAAGGPAARPIAPAAFLLSARAKQEREAIREARRAQLLSDAGELARAREIWDRLAQADGPLDPARIAWERALVRWRAGELEAAYAALAPLETAQGVFDARAHGLVARGVLADALGRRDEALRLYARAQAHLDSHPEYSFLDPLRARIAAGRAAPLSADTLPTTEHWMNLWW